MQLPALPYRQLAASLVLCLAALLAAGALADADARPIDYLVYQAAPKGAPS